MPLTIGSQLGFHEITALLGKGGMGEVYRARDLKLKREVAIKILPDEFSRDTDRVSRFQREAEVLASLNHPNIGAIHDLQETNGTRYLVLELVGGETLAERLMRGPIPLDEVVQVARQIVDALEAAHERGIVHRDLKPGNIKIDPDGKVKVLDFGLAKVSTPSAAAEAFSNSPTLVSGSLGGVILGTAAYMSPEQARGKAVDARTDVWAFGCVLYQMLTGKQAFPGETTTDVLAKVLEAQPKWEALPAETPPSIRMLLEAALNKDTKQRLQHIGDARMLLNRPAILDKLVPVAVRDRSGRRGWIAAASLALILAAALIPASLYFLRAPAELPVMRVEMPAAGISGTPVISPDGQRIAYVANNSGKTAIWIRPFGSLAAQLLPGTENASGDGLFWAPDSHRLAFYADRKLKKIDVAGGGVQTLCDAPTFQLPGAWNKDGVILFGSILDGASGIVRISDSGGTPVRVTTADPSNGVQLIPRFLPDGRHFLFHILRGPDQSGGVSGSLYLGSLDSKSATRLMELPGSNEPNSGAEYAQGYLLFLRDKTLFAQPFDPVRGTLGGEPSAVGENVSRNFSVSETGVLVSAPGQSGESAASRLAWFDRKGKPAGEISTPGKVGSIRLFQDGRIALDNGGLGLNRDRDIWVVDARGVPIKVTSDNPNFDGYPVWSPDGMRLAFGSEREKDSLAVKLYQKSSNGLGAAEPLLVSDADAFDFPLDWTTNNIVFQRLKPANLTSEIWLLSMPEKKASAYVDNGFNNIQARVSPDGRYLAYATSESGSGSLQIVVQTFPDPKVNRWQITANGGSEPVWKPDGRELYYLAPDGKLMAVAVKSGPTFEAGQISELFQTALSPSGPAANPFAHRYAVSNDGQRFLIASGSNTSVTVSDSIPITAVVNWPATLRKK
jgi:Tol biopolymer transport system component